MKIVIKKTQKEDVLTVSCPKCSERVRSVALLRNCEVSGLVFRCKKCREYWEVEVTK